MLDLHVQLIDPSAQTARALFTFGSSPQLVDGVQKLADRWLKVFMTPKGSHPWRKTEGTTFAQLIGGNLDDLTTVEGEIIEAVNDCNEQLISADRQVAARPPNERLLTAAVVQFVQVPPSGLEFWVEVTNVARERLAVLIPYAAS